MATTRICSIPNCNKAVNARGFCGTHYQRWRQHGDPLVGGPVIDRQKQLGTCSTEGCEKPAKKRGMCDPHYRRFMQHGSPTGGPTMRGEPMDFIHATAIHHPGDDCLIWPYARASNGYAHVRDDGEAKLASRIICELRHGPAPTPEHEAAHSCGNGHLGCISPAHLSWKTPSGNQMDRVDHGTSNRGEQNAQAILTADDVRAIRSLRGTMTYKEIAPQFGVEWKTIAAIMERRAWAWLSG